MEVQVFESAGELKDYVVAQGIVNADIAAIIQKDGKWYLFHF